MIAPAQDGGTGMIVGVFICPLPDVAYHIHNTEGAGAGGMGIYIIGSKHHTVLIRKGRWSILRVLSQDAVTTGWSGCACAGCQSRRQPTAVTPRISATVSALCGILPLPLVRKPQSSPTGVSARILYGHPGNRLVGRAFGIVAVLPIFEEVQVVAGMVVCGVEKLLELGVGHGILAHVKRLDLHGVFMKPPR